jgi:predicted RecB family endonuclease
VAAVTLVQAVLPDLDDLDAEALRALVLEKHAELISYKTELISYRTELNSYKQEIENLKLLIAKLRRMQFGRKSEKLSQQIEQLELRLEDLETKRARREASAPGKEATPAKPHGDHYLLNCHERRSCWNRNRNAARIVVEGWTISARTYPKCWSTCRRSLK